VESSNRKPSVIRPDSVFAVVVDGGAGVVVGGGVGGMVGVVGGGGVAGGGGRVVGAGVVVVQRGASGNKAHKP